MLGLDRGFEIFNDPVGVLGVAEIGFGGTTADAASLGIKGFVGDVWKDAERGKLRVLRVGLTGVASGLVVAAGGTACRAEDALVGMVWCFLGNGIDFAVGLVTGLEAGGRLKLSREGVLVIVGRPEARLVIVPFGADPGLGKALGGPTDTLTLLWPPPTGDLGAPIRVGVLGLRRLPVDDCGFRDGEAPGDRDGDIPPADGLLRPVV